MKTETLDDVIQQLADWIGVYGACKSESDEGCQNENPLCCRTGFEIEIRDRILKAIQNERKDQGFEPKIFVDPHYRPYRACFTIGVQTFHVCERDDKSEAEFFVDMLKEAFKNAGLIA